MMWWLVTHPRRVGASIFDSLLNHRVVDGTEVIADVSILYEITIIGVEEPE